MMTESPSPFPPNGLRARAVADTPVSGRWRTLASLALGFMLVACGDRASGDAGESGVSYIAINHTDKGVSSITVNGEGGILNSPPQGGGGKEMCCVSLPDTWRPGQKITIRWQIAGTFVRDKKGNMVLSDGVPIVIQGPWKTRTVDLPEYKGKDAEGRLHIHFLPGDEVKVLRSMKGFWSSEYPIPYPTKKAPEPAQP